MPHITFIHGMLNKPEEKVLTRIWKNSLSAGGFNLDSSGVTSSMVYWADFLYASPLKDQGPQNEGAEVKTTPEDEEGISDWFKELEGDERRFVEALLKKWQLRDEDLKEGVYQPLAQQPGGGFQALPLPSGFEKIAIARLLKDVHHYLFNVEFSPRPGPKVKIQSAIRKRFVEQLIKDRPADGLHVVVGHSLGTVMAYDCLKNVNECPGIGGFVTIGSPLGISEVYNHFKPPYQRDYAYPSGKISGWHNFSAWGDVVSLDMGLRQEYRENGKKVVEDEIVTTPGVWKHSAHKYLAKRKIAHQLKILTNRL